jgi:hypothetical protein
VGGCPELFEYVEKQPDWEIEAPGVGPVKQQDQVVTGKTGLLTNGMVLELLGATL